MEPTPIEQITALFDLTALVTFFVTAAATIIAFSLAKKGFIFARNLIKFS